MFSGNHSKPTLIFISETRKAIPNVQNWLHQIKSLANGATGILTPEFASFFAPKYKCPSFTKSRSIHGTACHGTGSAHQRFKLNFSKPLKVVID